MKVRNRWIMGSAIGLAAIAAAIDHTRHRLPEPMSAEHAPPAAAGDTAELVEAPCGLEVAPCGLDVAPCGLDTNPCGLGGNPCSLEPAPCSL